MSELDHISLICFHFLTYFLVLNSEGIRCLLIMTSSKFCCGFSVCSAHYLESESCPVMSDSLRPRRLYSPWNSIGQNSGVGSLSLLQGIFQPKDWTQGWKWTLKGNLVVFYLFVARFIIDVEFKVKKLCSYYYILQWLKLRF